ncbi:hypothetical protein D3C81_1512520 [compost metagenome]
MITVTPLDPTRPVTGVFFLPERRTGFQVIHDKGAGVECRLTMGAGRADEDNRLARFQGADAVQHFQLEQRPALLGLDGNLAEGLFGHARIVFEEHPGDVEAVIEVAHVADKTHHRTHADIGIVHGIDFGTRVERGGLHANRHGSASGHSRKERHFIALADRLVELAQVFVAGAHQVLLAQHLGTVTLGQQCADVVDGGEVAFHFHRVQPQRFTITGEKLHGNVHDCSAWKCPLLPPTFSSRRTLSMVMPRSTALHMS